MVKKTNCNIKITEIKNKKPDFGGLVIKVALSTKATKIANKITIIDLLQLMSLIG